MDFSGLENGQLLGCRVAFSAHPQGFAQRFGETGRVVNTWWEQQRKIKGEDTFGEWVDTGGIIPRDNPAGHCFIFDSCGYFPVSHYFKSLVKFVLKLLEIPFSQNMAVYNQGTNGVIHE